MTTGPLASGEPDDQRLSAAELLRRIPEVMDVPDQDLTVERVLTELADLQVAHEELRVAEEQMRAQREQITHLLLQHEAERRWRGQMSALVPVGLCATDGAGAMVDANPALANHLGTPLHRLQGEPLSVHLGLDDAGPLQWALSRLASGAATEHRLVVTVRPQNRPEETAQLFGFVETMDATPTKARIQWVLVRDEPATIPPSAAVVDDPGFEPEAAEIAPPIPAAVVLGLASSLAQLSSLPVGDGDRQRLLGRMAVLVQGAVPAADWVSVTLGSPMEPQRLGSDSAQAQEFDGRQVRVGEGPCVEAYDTGAIVVTGDVAADPRWPSLARTMAHGEVRSVLALPVRDDGTTIGGVNAYSGRVRAFTSADQRIAELATAAVAGVLQNVAEREAMRTLAENLERALTSRAEIDQSKGVLMARLGVSADEAFARLVALSSRLNVKVRDLARLVIDGQMDALLRTDD